MKEKGFILRNVDYTEEDRKRLKFVTNSEFKYNYGILIILADELKAVKIEYYSSGIKLGSD